MFRGLFLLAMLGALVVAPVKAADRVYPGGGVLAQVVDGNGTQTTITLVNLDSLPAPYTLYFYGDDGSPLTLSTTAGTAAQLSGTLTVGGSTIIETNGGGAAQLQGYAVLTAPNQGAFADNSGLYHYTVAGTAVFKLTLPLNSVAEATVPLDTGYDSVFALPFDHTVAVTGVAIANTYQATALPIAITAYDPSGNVIFTDTTFQLPGYGHTSFLLTDKYPQLAGKQGMVYFKPTVTDTTNNPNGAVNALGLRANLAGTSLSTVTPMVPCYYVSNINGSGCTN